MGYKVRSTIFASDELLWKPNMALDRMAACPKALISLFTVFCLTALVSPLANGAGIGEWAKDTAEEDVADFREVERVSFDWDGDGKLDTVIFDKNHQYDDPGEYSRVTLELSGGSDAIDATWEGMALTDHPYSRFEPEPGLCASPESSRFVSVCEIPGKLKHRIAVFGEFAGAPYGTMFVVYALGVLGPNSIGKPMISVEGKLHLALSPAKDSFMIVNSNSVYEGGECPTDRVCPYRPPTVLRSAFQAKPPTFQPDPDLTKQLIERETGRPMAQVKDVYVLFREGQPNVYGSKSELLARTDSGKPVILGDKTKK